MAIVSDGQVALRRIGVANWAAEDACGPDTRFDIGSVTKTFTALGVLLLYQESQGTSRPLEPRRSDRAVSAQYQVVQAAREMVADHHKRAACND